MEGPASNPYLHALLIPLLISISGMAAFRFFGRAENTLKSAGIVVGLAFLAAYLLIMGRPPFPPVAAAHKLFYMVTIGFIIGLGLDLSPGREQARRIFAMSFPMMSAYWLGYTGFHGDALSPEVLKFLGITFVGGYVMIRLDKLTELGIYAPIILFFTSLGLAGTSYFGGAGTVTQLSLALATATLGYLVWNWPDQRFPVGGLMLLGIGGALLFLTSQSLYVTKTSPVAIFTLLPIFFMDTLVGKFMAGQDRVAARIKPLVLSILCAIPMGLAIWVSALLHEKASPF